MADVQVKHGYTRVANALLEAIAFARFDGTMFSIVLCLVRLTYGWNRRTVRIFKDEVAQRCNTRATGGFRAKFDLLVREGVVVEVEPRHGRTPGVYAVNKNFERWGRFSVPAAALLAMYQDRPPNSDGPRAANLLSQSGDQTDLGFDDVDPDTMPANSAENRDSIPPSQGRDNSVIPPSQGRYTDSIPPSQGRHSALVEASHRPYKGGINRPKSNNDTAIRGGERQERQERQTAASETAAAGLSSAEFKSAIISAALAAVRLRWPDHFLNLRQADALAQALIDENVDVGLATRAIESCVARKLGGPPASIAYFRDRVLDAHRDRLHDDLKHGDDPPANRRRSKPPSSLASLVDPNAESRADQYQEARTAAAIAWGRNPDNAPAYFAITAAANKQFDGMLNTSWGAIGRDRDILERCAQAANFPDLDQWTAERIGNGNRSKRPTASESYRGDE